MTSGVRKLPTGFGRLWTAQTVSSLGDGVSHAALPLLAFLGGWLATTYDIRTPLYAAAGLLLAMTAITASMTSNRRVEAALRAAASKDPVQESAPNLL